jgi:DNA repair exonuclease SbcCD ATPase subunit
MAEDPNSPLNQALAGLGTTINTITDKVEAGKERVRAYKAQIIAKLGEVVQQLNSLKDNNNLKALPQLRKQLQDSQAALQQKTEELDQTKASLDEANRTLQQFQQSIDEINRQLEEKNQQITDLTNSGKQKDKAIQELDAQVRELDKQKEEAERNLVSAQQQIDSLVQRISQINATLVNQIQLIDTIANELGDLDSGDVAQQFNAVTDNIKIIVDMLNSAGQGGVVQQEAQQFSQEVEDLYQKFINADQPRKDNFYRNLNGSPNQSSINVIQNNIRRAIDRNDDQSINAIKGELQKIITSGNVPLLGGKSRKHRRHRKRKTMKKKQRKTRKLKRYQMGGYVYSASRDLDKASSIISASSSKPHSKKSRRNKSMK